MDNRYQTEMSSIWSDLNKFSYWLEIELQVVEGWASLGVIPFEEAEIVVKTASFDIDKIHEYEKQTKHDFAAFIDVISESVDGDLGRWIHYGLTSSDVIDTALSLQIIDAINLLKQRLIRLVDTLRAMSVLHRDTLMVGRTHGVHAEEITFGQKVELWALEMERNLVRLESAQNVISVGAISGTVGTHTTVSPEVEQSVCSYFGLRPEPSKQIISRDRHAEFIWSLASIATSLESIALQIRLLSQTEISEVREPFYDKQKGSSAMPHKRNPVRSERITGLARVVRGYVPTALENNVLWHERDISHSSVERIILPEASQIVDFMLLEMIDIIEHLVVVPTKMTENLNANNGVIHSHQLLLLLIKRGLSRNEAYRKIQELSFRAIQEQVSLRELVENEVELKALVSKDEIEDLFGGHDVQGID